MPGSQFTWDPQRRVYRDKRGRIVPASKLREWQEAAERAHRADVMARGVSLLDWKRENDIRLVGAEIEIPGSMTAIVDAFVPDEFQEDVARIAKRIGKLEPREWQREMQRLINVSHEAMAVFGAGGFAQTTVSIWTKVQQVIARETTYEVRMAAQMAAGQVSPAEILNRSSQYAEQIHSTWQNTIIVRDKEAGMEEGRRFLEPDASHCQECFDEAARGWVPLEDVLPIGETPCAGRCRCTIHTRRSGDEEERAA
jgi:hypothetical protein